METKEKLQGTFLLNIDLTVKMEEKRGSSASVKWVSQLSVLLLHGIQGIGKVN